MKRVPGTEQRRADLVKSLQGTLVDSLAGRPAGRPGKTAPQALPVATPPEATASEGPNDDASERGSAKAQDLTPPMLPHVIPVLHAAENEPSSASGPMDVDLGGAQVDPASDDHAQVRSSTPAQSSPDDRTNQGGKRSVQPASQPEQSESNVNFAVKRDARAAELPDEDEQGGKFQQVEGLTTVDAGEIPCDFSVEDDFEIDETAEGVDGKIDKVILAGKKKEPDAMEAFGIFDVCEELPKDAKNTLALPCFDSALRPWRRGSCVSSQSIFCRKSTSRHKRLQRSILTERDHIQSEVTCQSHLAQLFSVWETLQERTARRMRKRAA